MSAQQPEQPQTPPLDGPTANDADLDRVLCDWPPAEAVQGR